MTTPMDPRRYSPTLKAMFHIVEQAIDTELRAAWTGLNDDQAAYLRRRIISTLLWGTPEGGPVPSQHEKFTRVEEPRLRGGWYDTGHLGGLLGGEVEAARPPVPSRWIVVASREEQAREYAHRVGIPRDKLVTVTSERQAATKLRGTGPGTEIVVLEYPDEDTEEMVRIVSTGSMGATVLHPRADSDTPALEHAFRHQVAPGEPPRPVAGAFIQPTEAPEAKVELVAILGGYEHDIRQYAAKNGYANVFALTTSNPSAVRGLAPGSKLIVLGQVSPDIERIIAENQLQVERVRE